VDDILANILNIEAEARAIVSEARELATMLEEEARDDAERTVAEARQQAEQEVAEMRAQARQEIEEQRARIRQEADGVPEQAGGTEHFDEAVDYVVDVIAGRREGKG
jgi:vacuolar-type H+-ATPase subunit H